MGTRLWCSLRRRWCANGGSVMASSRSWNSTTSRRCTATTRRSNKARAWPRRPGERWFDWKLKSGVCATATESVAAAPCLSRGTYWLRARLWGLLSEPPLRSFLTMPVHLLAREQQALQLPGCVEKPAHCQSSGDDRLTCRVSDFRTTRPRKVRCRAADDGLGAAVDSAC